MKPVLKRRDPVLNFRIRCDPWHQHANPPHPFSLLRARRDWPRRDGTTDCPDEIPPFHATPRSLRVAK
jgi:hypothetical protein